jgi:hypothetical protein
MTDYKTQTYEVDPVAAEIIRRIFDLYIEGWGYKKIANQLTEESIPTPRMREKELKEAKGLTYRKEVKKEWSIISVSDIIHNDFYMGVLRTGKYTRKGINGKDVKLDDSEHHVFESFHEAIIDRNTFDTATEMAKKRTTNNYRGVKKYDNVYSGFVFCGDCQSPMFSISSAKRPNAYTCGTYHKRGLKGCTSHHTLESTLNLLVKRYVENVRDNAAEFIEQLNADIKAASKDNNQRDDLITILEKEMNERRNELKALKMQHIRETMKKPGDADLIDELYEEMEAELANKLRGLQSQLDRANQTKVQSGRIKEIARDALQIFDEIIQKDKLTRKDLEFIIERIVIYTDRIEVRLRADIDVIFNMEGSVSVNSRGNIEKTIEIAQSTPNHKDKIYHANVDSKGDPLLTTLTKKEKGIFALSSLADRVGKVIGRLNKP